jgi:hypothetical protein
MEDNQEGMALFKDGKPVFYKIGKIEQVMVTDIWEDDALEDTI